MIYFETWNVMFDFSIGETSIDTLTWRMSNLAMAFRF